MTDVLADNQFECVRGALVDLGAFLNIAAADEHVPEVERCIRTIKERVSSIYNSLTFKKNAYQVDCRNDLHFSVLVK